MYVRTLNREGYEVETTTVKTNLRDAIGVAMVIAELPDIYPEAYQVCIYTCICANPDTETSCIGDHEIDTSDGYLACCLTQKAQIDFKRMLALNLQFRQGHDRALGGSTRPAHSPAE